MYCQAQCSWIFFVFLGVTLDAAETPFAYPLFLAPEFDLIFSFQLCQDMPCNSEITRIKGFFNRMLPGFNQTLTDFKWIVRNLAENWVLPEDLCKKDPCNFNTEIFVSKVGQLMSNSWSTSSQPDFVHALGRRKTARNRQGKILYTELLKSWPTLGQLLANSPPHGKLQGSSLQ